MKNLFNILKAKVNLKLMMAVAICFAGFYSTANAQDAVVVASPSSVNANKTNADFPGGMDKFYSYVSSQLKLDTTCSPGKRLEVSFMVDKEGKLCRVKVRKHVLSDKMNTQLVKIFENAPQWIPAQQNGAAIKEHFVCPVSFMPKADMMAVNKP